MFTFDLISDIHTERHDYCQSKVPIFGCTSGNDILILAGDVGTLCQESKIINFLRKCQNRYRTTIYIPGNHEYDGGLEMEETENRIRESCTKLNRGNMNKIYFMSNEMLIIEENDFRVKILCTTLWSRPHSLSDEMLRDHKIKKMDSSVREKKHLESRKFLSEYISDDVDRVIVITHHAPSFKLLNPYFCESSEL